MAPFFANGMLQLFLQVIGIPILDLNFFIQAFVIDEDGFRFLFNLQIK